MKIVLIAISLFVSSSIHALNCNGDQSRCQMRYDQVSYLATHAAMASTEHHFVPPAQHFGFTKQLNDGVRAFLVEAHEHKKTTYLCQWSCDLGSLSAFEAFYDVAQYMQANPREVVTLIINDQLDIDMLAKTLRESGLADLAHSQTPNTRWPTLDALISSGKRLVIFNQLNRSATYPWLHFFDDFVHIVQDTERGETPSVCKSDPRAPERPFLLVLHSENKPYVTEKRASMINNEPNLSRLLARCIDATNKLPNFLAVDFYELGDTMHAIDQLNLLTRNKTASLL